MHKPIEEIEKSGESRIKIITLNLRMLRVLFSGCVFILFLNCPSFSQERGNIISGGQMPESFILSLESRMDLDQANNTSGSLRRTKEEFYLKSNFFIKNILQSGYVVFNNEVTNYLNEVLNQVMLNDPIRNDVEVYLIKSARSNAFASDQGIIFVTTGLIAQLENEAQLAFILAHELTHFIEEHSISQHIEENTNFSQREKADSDEYLRQMSNYSKALELEADSNALKILSKTNYDLNACLTVFDVLQFSYLPFNEIDLELSLFENDQLKIPEKLYLKEPTPIDFEIDDDDSRSTHPSIKKRIEAIKRLSGNSQSEGGKTFIIDENEFNQARKICRDEVIRIEQVTGNYIRSFYNSSVMNKKYPNDSYYKKAMSKALYGITKYKNHGNYKDIDYEDQEGSLSRYFYFFENLSSIELNTLALSTMMKLNVDQSPFVDSLICNLAMELIETHEVDYDQLLFEPYEKLILNEEEEKQEEMLDSLNLTKYEKIRLEKSKITKESKVVSEDFEDNFHLFAFEKKDSLKIKNTLILANKKLKIIEAEYAHEKTKIAKDYPTFKERKLILKEQKIQKRNTRHNIVSLGIDKLVYVDPYAIDMHERSGINYYKSENQSKELSDQIKQLSLNTELQVEVLSPQTFDQNSSDVLNDIGNLNVLAREASQHHSEDFYVPFIPLQSEYTKYLNQKYNTPNFCFHAFINLRFKEVRPAQKILLPILMGPYGAPFLIWSLLPNYSSLVYYSIIDTQSGKIVFEEEKIQGSKQRKSSVKSDIYDKLIQFNQ